MSFQRRLAMATVLVAAAFAIASAGSLAYLLTQRDWGWPTVHTQERLVGGAVAALALVVLSWRTAASEPWCRRLSRGAGAVALLTLVMYMAWNIAYFAA